MIGLLLGAASAIAWTGEVLHTTDLAEPAERLVVLTRGEAEVGVLPGPTSTAVVDLATGTVLDLVPVGGRDAAAADLDGDGLDELLICGEHGLTAVTWEGPPGPPRPLASVPCKAVVVQVQAGQATVVTANEAARLWTPDGVGGLLDRGPYGSRLVGEPLLVIEGERLAIASIGGSEIVERSPWGRSVIATGGPIGGLVHGPAGWTWTLPAEGRLADVTHGSTPVAPMPGLLLTAETDRDDRRELIVLHPGWGRIGRLRADVEETSALPIAATHLAIADVDRDGCDEIVLLAIDPPQLTTLRSRECTAQPLIATEPLEPWKPIVISPPPPPVDGSVALLGLTLPPFVGPDTADRGVWPRTDVLFGAGWVVGATRGTVWLELPSFPALALTAEAGGPHARFVYGVDSAGFFLWVTETGGGVHLANFMVGSTFGGRDLSMGPFVTAGLFNAGAGLRTVWTPWDARTGSRVGFEARLTWFAPTTGEAMLLYVWRSSHERRRPTAALDLPLDPRRFCRRFELAVGGAGGATSTRLSWEFVGSEVPYAASGSFAVGAACEAGEGPVGFLLGVETAPLFSYVVPPLGDRVHHMASHTVGLMLGNDLVRIGPIATAGFWTLGGGARIGLTPFQDGQGLRHGIDLRAVALVPYGPSFEAMLLYGVWMDPRRGGG